MTEPQPWSAVFTPFGLFHMITLGGFCGFIALVCIAGLRAKRVDREPRVRMGWVFFAAAWQIAMVVWYLLPANFDVRSSLPLHICDLVGLVAPIALALENRPLRTVLYFWGIGLSTQGFATPVIEVGWAHIGFWLFWVGHTVIIGSATYDVVVRGYRPGWRDFAWMCGLNVIVLGLLMRANHMLDANYGYVGHTLPDNPTLLDHLGEWPMRVVWVFALATLIQLLVWLPWVAVAKLRTPKTGA